MFGLPLQWVVTALVLKAVVVVIAAAWYYRKRAQRLEKELRDAKAAAGTYKRVVQADRHRNADDDTIRGKLRDYGER